MRQTGRLAVRVGSHRAVAVHSCSHVQGVHNQLGLHRREFLVADSPVDDSLDRAVDMPETGRIAVLGVDSPVHQEREMNSRGGTGCIDLT